MSSNLNIPDHYNIHTDSTIGGTIDMNSTLAIKELPKIELDADVTTTSSLNSTSAVQLAITELPVIRLEFGMKPTRIHFPTNMKFNVCALGVEILSFGTCGESMVVIEDYVPHALEECR